MIVLSMFLAVASPAEDNVTPYNGPKFCTVEWADSFDEQFVRISQPRIEARCNELAQALGHEEPESIHLDIGGGVYTFTLRVSITGDGEVLYDDAADDVCECDREEFAAEVAARVATGLNALRTPKESPPPEVPPEQPPPTPSQQPPAPAKHPLRWAGVGVGLAGVALGVTGGVLMPRTKSDPGFGSGDFGRATTRRHPLPMTAAFVGVGAALATAGLVMIIVDAKNSKKNKRASLVPAIAPEHIGLTLRGRF